MLQIKKIAGILSFISVSLFSWASCPSVLDVLNSNDVGEIKNLISQFSDCPDGQDSLALSYHKLGVLYNSIDLDSAIIFTKKGLEIRIQLFQNNPNIDLGKSYHNLGYFYVRTGQNKQAKKPLEQAIEIYKKLDSPRVINSYLELANVNVNLGEYELAENLYNLIIIEAKKNEDTLTLIRAQVNLGDLLNGKKEYRKAIDRLQEAMPYFLDFKESIEEPMCFHNMGKAYYFLNDYPKAISNYKKAIALYSALDICDEVAKSYSNLGSAYQKNGEDRLAFIALEKGLQKAKYCESAELIAQSYDNIGAYYLVKGDPEKALSYFQNSIKPLIPNFEPKTDLENPSKEQLLYALNKIDLLVYFSDKANALRQLYEKEKKSDYLNKALELYKLGDILIDQLRKEHSDEDTKLFWRKEVIPFYEEAIAICYQLKETQQAFFFFEKSKAILLLEALQSSDALASVPDSIRNTTYRLKKQLIEIREELKYENGSRRLNLLKKLVEIQRSFDVYTAEIAKLYPRYFDAKFGTEIIKLSDFQKDYLTANGRTSIHYFYGIKNVFVLKTNNQQTEIYNLGITKNIESEIRKFLTFFEKSAAIENAPQDFLEQSSKLYDLLLKPMSVTTASELIIFSDGALAYLPFEALISSPSNDLATASYLIKDCMTRYGYSATILSPPNSTLPAQSLQPAIAAFAPFAEKSINTNHPVLAFSNDELGSISKKVDGLYLKNQNASRSNFLINMSQYAVLHLSTHAFSSSTETKPNVVFADTALYLSELYSLDISANLVVLSACQTNIGQLSPGEGVMSLGRGFTYAGAKSLVSSLWNVNAMSTSNVLSKFYDAILNKVPKYEALHLAKKAYLEDESIPAYERSPYYWAGLVYYGDDQGVVLNQSKSNWFYGVTSIVLLLLAGGFLFWKYK
jgi:CHAT domain-containing protein